jgi:hypothetical protein
VVVAPGPRRPRQGRPPVHHRPLTELSVLPDSHPQVRRVPGSVPGGCPGDRRLPFGEWEVLQVAWRHPVEQRREVGDSVDVGDQGDTFPLGQVVDPMMVAFLTAHGLLLVAFGVGLWRSGGQRRSLRWVGRSWSRRRPSGWSSIHLLFPMTSRDEAEFPRLHAHHLDGRIQPRGLHGRARDGRGTAARHWTPPSSFSAAASAVLVAPAWRMWPSGGCDTLLSDQLLQAALGEPNVHVEESQACPDGDPSGVQGTPLDVDSMHDIRLITVRNVSQHDLGQWSLGHPPLFHWSLHVPLDQGGVGGQVGEL